MQPNYYPPQQPPSAPYYPPQQPAQQYPPQQPPSAPYYPPQQPAQQYPPQQPPAPVVNGTLSDFLSQPKGGEGPAISFKNKPHGTRYEGYVARKILDSDTRAQTNDSGQIQTFRDGRPKLVLVIPLIVPVSQEHPEGRATWWVRGQSAQALAQAMASVGAPEIPEEGAWVSVTYASDTQARGMFQPAKQYQVEYRRPRGANAPVSAPANQPAPVPANQPAPVPANQPAPVPAAPQAPPGVPGGMTPEQQELFRQMLGQQQA